MIPAHLTWYHLLWILFEVPFVPQKLSHPTKRLQRRAGLFSRAPSRVLSTIQDKNSVQYHVQFHFHLFASRCLILVSAVCSARLRVCALTVLLLLETITRGATREQ